MIPRFTMRQALSAPDLLGKPLSRHHCQHGVACLAAAKGQRV
jgi:hypothetical protein